ncbi:MAG: phosphatase PAP2 family protein [Thermodesulfobacteriota bacterium]|nr:phosphatase PAP2 family protein [Thermodesulfobacteriota bacterium]
MSGTLFDLHNAGGTIAVLGIIFSCVGLLHNLSPVRRLDEQSSLFLHQHLQNYLTLFRMLWLFGKSPALIALLIITFLFDRQNGAMIILFYLLIACSERGLKLALKRQRPFSLLGDIEMHQPRQPYDPSYPSGDAMRVWYLALVLPIIFSLPWVLSLFLGCIALLASLGRIAFGVHFLLDVIGGAGLGLLGAGLYFLYL